MNTPFTLAQALRQARTELERELPPPGLGAAVSAAAQAALVQRTPGQAPRQALARPEPRTSPWARPWAWSGAMTCAAVLLASVVLMLRVPALDAPSAPLQLGGFVPVVPPEQWPAQDAPAWLVSTELRRDRLAALGLPFDPARAGDSVPAELLVRASGEVLAVRFLQ